MPQSPQQPPSRYSRHWLIAVGVCIVFVLGMSAGALVTARTDSHPLTVDEARALLSSQSGSHADAPIDFVEFWQVWDLIKSSYVNQPVSDQDLFYGALAGLVDGLGDPHSTYFTPAESAEFYGEINGSFQGIGAEIGIKKDVLTIIAPLPQSPAERSGLQAGDYIVQIDGEDTSGMSVGLATQKIRGEKGTSVTLTIAREGAGEFFDVVIERDDITFDSVHWNLDTSTDQRLGVITITHFNSDTTNNFQKAMNELLLQNPDGFVIDLRNNAGGFLDAAVSIGSQFITKGDPILYEQNSAGDNKPFVSAGPASLADFPVVVLINAGSASASEILAGALQDTGHATVIGTTSFGKGTVQELRPLDDGSSVKITVAKWLTPEYHLIDGLGIYPDFEVDRTLEQFSNDLDPQFDAALQYLTDRDGFMASHSRFEPPAVP